MRELSRRQIDCLEAIKAYIASHGYPPTLRELGKILGIKSTNGVNDHIRALERKGFLRRVDVKSRGIVLERSGRTDDTPRGPIETPTPGTWKQRMRCLRCAAVTFSQKCSCCRSEMLEVAA